MVRLACNTGRISFTVSRRQVGLYDITYSTAYPNNNYVINAIPIGAFVQITLGAETLILKHQYTTYTGSGTGVDCAFSLQYFKLILFFIY
jgi:hypothetical protein